MALALLFGGAALARPHAHGGRARSAVATPPGASIGGGGATDGGATTDGGALDGGALDGGAAGSVRSFTAEAPPQATFGEAFPYTIRVTHPKGEVIALPRAPDLGDFDLDGADKQELPNGQQVTTVFALKLRAWTVGKKAIGDLELEVQAPGGATQLTVPGPTVEVRGTLDPDAGEASALRDIAPPVELPVRTYRVLWGILAALGLGALAYAVVRQLKKPRPAHVAPPPPAEPAHVRARKALEALLALDLPGKGRQRELYFQISEITRRYLGETYGFSAIDLTTHELLSALRKRPTPGLDIAAFARTCTDADLVKFAKLQPDADDCKAAIDAALALVATVHRASQPGGPA